MTKTMSSEEVQRVLAENRAKIDDIDRRMVELLNQRAGAVLEIGRAKEAVNIAVYDPKREEIVFRNVLGANAGPLAGDALRRVFERIIDEMRNLENQDRKTAAHGDS